MTVEFDPGTGRLSLDHVAFDALHALATDAEPPAKGLTRIREAGVVTDTAIHPRIRPAMAPITDPITIGRLEMLSDEGAQVVAECWVGVAATTYLVGPLGEQARLISTPPAFFPVSIARLVGLSPRPRAAFQPWRIPVAMVDQVFSEQPQTRRVARASIDQSTDDADTRAYAVALERGPWWYWNLAVHWPGTPDNDGTRTLHVVDTREGMALMSLSDERIAFDPTDPTEVFGLLASILPRDHELDPSRGDHN